MSTTPTFRDLFTQAEQNLDWTQVSELFTKLTNIAESKGDQTGEVYKRDFINASNTHHWTKAEDIINKMIVAAQVPDEAHQAAVTKTVGDIAQRRNDRQNGINTGGKKI